MGQQNSHLAGQGDSRPTGPPARPSSPPSKPPTPRAYTDYLVAQNKVLPSGGNMDVQRRLLRPVSQELTKFHPEYADLFSYDLEGPFQAGGKSSSLGDLTTLARDNKENNITANNGGLNSNNFTNTTQQSVSNGDLTHSNGAVPNGVVPNNSEPPVRNIRRTNSLERDRKFQHRHRRQASLQHSTSLQGVVIPEDPREHLYNITRKEAFSNAIPSTTSLPVKNSSNLDYSFQLTYAQLAADRRQKREEAMEESTGKKMEEMAADISAANTVPKSPFDRKNLGEKSSPHSVSTGSSETSPSKSKKKKAPAPPPPTTRDQSPGGFSMTTEPPADYDMEDVTLTSATNRRSRSPQRKNPPPSRPQSVPATLPKPTKSSGQTVAGPSSHRQQLSDASSISAVPLPPTATTSTTSAPPAPPPPPPAPPLPATPGKSNPISSSVQKSMSQARAQIEALKKLEDVLKAAGPSEPNEDSVNNITEIDSLIGGDAAASGATTTDIDSLIKSDNEKKESSDNSALDVSKEKESFSLSVSDDLDKSPSPAAVAGPESKPSAMRMSSLLQNDIVLAAQARGSRIVKAKPPPTLQKPKDPAELFREELAKAASERAVRRQNSIVEDKQKGAASEQPNDRGSIVFESKFLKVAKKSTLSTEVDAEKDDIAPPPSEAGSNGSQRVLPPSWTPADDLQSDEDMMDGSYVGDVTRDVNLDASVSTEGFKSSLVPPKLKELKHSKKKKDKKQKKAAAVAEKVPNKENANAHSKENEVQSQEVKPQGNNMRRLRKGVKNAFGSLSKASGKLLKKHKSLDVLGGPSGDSAPITKQHPTRGSQVSLNPQVSMNPNWEMSGVHNGAHRRRVSDGSTVSVPVDKGVADPQTSDNESEDDVIISEDNLDVSDDTNSGVDEEDNEGMSQKLNLSNGAREMSQLKRAGVAYLNENGEIIVLPESPTGNQEGHQSGSSKHKEDDRKSGRIFKKKKKSSRDRNRRGVDTLSKEIRHKEKQIEYERLKQKEAEIDLLRLRDLEAQERLQRQITLLQQQQIHQAHASLNNVPPVMPVDPRAPASSSNIPQGQGQSSFAAPNQQMYNTPYQHAGQGMYMNQASTSMGATSSHHMMPSQQYMTSPQQNMTPPHHHMTSPQQQMTSPQLQMTSPHQQMMTSQQQMPPSPFSALFAPQSASRPPSNSPYVPHSSPIIGNGIPQMGTPSALPQLTPQDLGVLSEYMKMAGVTPPSTQQQWAVLLGTVTTPGAGFSGFAGFSGTSSSSSSAAAQQPSASSTRQENDSIASNFSQLFGKSSSGKTLESTTGGNVSGGSKKHVIGVIAGSSQTSSSAPNLSPLERLSQHDGIYYKNLFQSMLEAASAGSLNNNSYNNNNNNNSNNNNNIGHISSSKITPLPSSSLAAPGEDNTTTSSHTAEVPPATPTLPKTSGEELDIPAAATSSSAVELPQTETKSQTETETQVQSEAKADIKSQTKVGERDVVEDIPASHVPETINNSESETTYFGVERPASALSSSTKLSTTIINVVSNSPKLSKHNILKTHPNSQHHATNHTTLRSSSETSSETVPENMDISDSPSDPSSPTTSSTTSTSTSTSTQSPSTLPAKVYGPLGFRPVAFQTASS